MLAYADCNVHDSFVLEASDMMSFACAGRKQVLDTDDSLSEWTNVCEVGKNTSLLESRVQEATKWRVEFKKQAVEVTGNQLRCLR